MSKPKYVIFREIDLGDESPEAAMLPESGLYFIHVADSSYIETALRSHATEFDTPRAAYARAGKFAALSDWRVGVR